jgi:hypothetical protein
MGRRASAEEVPRREPGNGTQSVRGGGSPAGAREPRLPAGERGFLNERKNLTFNRSGQQSFDKIALERKEHEHGHDH